ncbi:MAG TPA: hypothetical protein PK200_15870, partial [Spirochaetota bacterium]|nr:hypothetical protein [Spirochaetota bacterium]
TGDACSQKKFIHSNMTWNNRIYLLNASPGRYAVVAARDEIKHSNFKGKEESITTKTYFFPRAMVMATVIDLGTAEVRYMGHHVVDHKGKPGAGEFFKIRNTDSVQFHYCKLISPYQANPSAGFCLLDLFFQTLTQANHNEYAYAAKTVRSDRTRRAEQNFLRSALEDLSGSEWVPLIRRRMR